MTERAFEVNFDGLVGPTHNYAGLSYGNVASLANRAQASSPKQAALQGLKKMKHLTELGLKQAVLPPQERPDVATLRRLGFTGSDRAVVEKAASEAPAVLAACMSASSMWTANAATIAPSADTADRKVHFTPANLNNKFHRSIEHESTGAALRAIFADESRFVHHHALPAVGHFGDEGAANHTRFCDEYGNWGLHFFVYGRHAFHEGRPEPKRFPARQTREASEAVARLHRLKSEGVIFAQQNPEVIDAGVFHNDVISVGNRNVILYHEMAFLDGERAIDQLREAYHAVTGKDLVAVRVPLSRVSVNDAVRSYLFNTQLLSPPGADGMLLVAPMECRETPSVHSFLEEMISDSSNPVNRVEYFDLRQSMQNGGGPACLRLRVVLSEKEIAASSPKVFMNDSLYERLVQWVERHYRDSLLPSELGDPSLMEESRAALDELTKILGLGSIYRFQKG